MHASKNAEPGLQYYYRRGRYCCDGSNRGEIQNMTFDSKSGIRVAFPHSNARGNRITCNILRVHPLNFLMRYITYMPFCYFFLFFGGVQTQNQLLI
jgi:hypothetical protein